MTFLQRSRRQMDAMDAAEAKGSGGAAAVAHRNAAATLSSNGKDERPRASVPRVTASESLSARERREMEHGNGSGGGGGGGGALVDDDDYDDDDIDDEFDRSPRDGVGGRLGGGSVTQDQLG